MKIYGYLGIDSARIGIRKRHDGDAMYGEEDKSKERRIHDDVKECSEVDRPAVCERGTPGFSEAEFHQGRPYILIKICSFVA